MNFKASDDNITVFNMVSNYLSEKELNIVSKDQTRPWGGFFVIDENYSGKFIAVFFPHLTNAALNISGKLSPKILVVAPDKRLSWQYHYRRAEIWKLIAGEAAVIVSDTDEETEIINLNKGDIIELKQGERHRLIGTDNWGVIAEIWRHTDTENPSNEDDIVRQIRMTNPIKTLYLLIFKNNDTKLRTKNRLEKFLFIKCCTKSVKKRTTSN
jgi:mannose-6-phosphate isomerase